MHNHWRSILLLICLTVLFASCSVAQEKQYINQMDRWSSGNENNLSGAVKSIRVEEQIYEFEGHFIYKHDKPFLKERFEFDRQRRKTEHYTYTTDGRESPKSISSYNEKNWIIKDNAYSALSQKPYLQTRYIYDEFGNVKEIAQYNIEDNSLLQKWVFTNDLQKKYFELTDFDSRNKQRMRVGFKRDEKCRLAEIFGYQPDGKLGVKALFLSIRATFQFRLLIIQTIMLLLEKENTNTNLINKEIGLRNRILRGKKKTVNLIGS